MLKSTYISFYVNSLGPLASDLPFNNVFENIMDGNCEYLVFIWINRVVTDYQGDIPRFMFPLCVVACNAIIDKT